MLSFATLGQQGNSTVAGAAAPSTSKRDLPQANIWLNFGYTVMLTSRDAEGNEATEERFVAIPVGIPLDTMEPIQIKTRSAEFAQFQAAQNDLLAQLKELGTQLQPGEARIVALDPNTGLSVQMRRINGPVEAPAADANNPFVAKLNLAAATAS
jgi:hypothetical protein